MRKKVFLIPIVLLITSALFVYKNDSNSEKVNSDAEIMQRKDEVNIMDELESKEIPILMYHNITEDPLMTNRITVTKERFERDMNFLVDKGYTTITFEDLINFKEGLKELPEKPIIITFDDGRKNIYDLAYPIMKEKNIKFTFFVIGKRLEQLPEDAMYGKYINWEQAKEMYDSGLAEIQPHTYDLHYSRESLTRGVGVLPLTGESEENYYNRFYDDTVKIIEAIKLNTGSDSYVYSFPYGKYHSISDIVLKDLGFKASVTTKTHYTDIKGDLWDLRRINVPCQIELEDLLRRVKEKEVQDIIEESTNNKKDYEIQNKNMKN